MKTRVGYAGGKQPSPTYRRIGDHMETIQIDYDPGMVSYERLLEVFFGSHDPTWPSPIRQYASAIFTHDDEQARLAKEALATAGSRSRRPVSTEILSYSGSTATSAATGPLSSWSVRFPGWGFRPKRPAR
ncbi:MAG: peptide-methionine (S)-S-oxide reductase [bacterium]|nr:peptide-methionine (S)-S-oxide reductase [bacterium]